MGFSFSFPSNLQQLVDAALADWLAGDKNNRLWQRDPSLWTNADEDRWLGWLEVVGMQQAVAHELTEFADEARREFSHALLLGMGGSSLFAEMLTLTFGPQPGFPELLVLDSTDPAQIAAVARRIDVARTMFIVASKSGNTLEAIVFEKYFWNHARALSGERAGRQFIALTDPGSSLEARARAAGYRRIFPGEPSIGGRYSAFSNFGMVPAAVMGLPAPSLLARVAAMVAACRHAADNPGSMLGVMLGTLGSAGRDKVTVLASASVLPFGAWLEQLIAESTGKGGKGLIPVDRERVGTPQAYGQDRVFVDLHVAGEATNGEAIAMLIAAGQPVIRIEFDELFDVVPECFCWEYATAVAGSILGIHPFNQPDVEASKIESRRLTSAYEATGTMPGEQPFLEEGSLQLFADERNAEAIRGAIRGRSGGGRRLASCLRAHLGRLQPGDYLALLAYLEMNEEHLHALQLIRHAIRNEYRVATCLGFGPRFLHSTGQAHKGGPNSGVFLQITCDDAADLPVPGQKYTFGVIKAAQARGDFEVLASRKRRALRVHLREVAGGLRALLAALDSDAARSA